MSNRGTLVCEVNDLDIVDTRVCTARASEVNDLDLISICVLVVVGALGLKF